MKSRVTTTKGDQGSTRILSGEILPKSHVILEATGAVDSLRAQIALLRLQVIDSTIPDREPLREFLFWLLHTTFLIGTEVNDPRNTRPEYRRDTIGPAHLKRLETEQARLEQGLSLPRAFIVTATNLPAAHADLTATVARELERQVVRLKEVEPSFDAQHLLPFLNRLSDYLYILARHLEAGQHAPVDYGTLDGEH
jgi:cob(I)alamin adenosyltransferase